MIRLALTALLVRDYDEALAFYCGAMGFSLVDDTDLGNGKRWVVIAGEGGGSLLLARAAVAIFRDLYGNRWDLIERA